MNIKLKCINYCEIVNKTQHELKFRYFYHPDHLGSSSYITDASGEVYQHFDGETFYEARADHHRTPYLYNGKELDKELRSLRSNRRTSLKNKYSVRQTGLYYYGARYYDPRIGMFYGVDPLMDKYPNFSPYAYTFNNPINLIDPTGMEGEDPDQPKSRNIVVINGHESPKDEALQKNIKAVENLDPSVILIKAKSKSDMLQQIKNSLSEGEEIRNLIIVGHGGYRDQGTFIGSEYINTKGKFTALGKDLSEFMGENSNIVMAACHSGGGINFDVSESRLQSLSNAAGANVIGNMSWGAASTERFSNSGSWLEAFLGDIKYASFTYIPADHKSKNAFPVNAKTNLLNWKMVLPNQSESKIIKKLYFTKYGGIKYED